MMSLRSTGRFAFLFCSVAAVAMPARAQVPAGAAPTREEVTRAPVGPQTSAPSRLRVEGGIERAPCPLAEPSFADVTVTLSDVVFDNLKMVAPADLRPAFESYLGKTVAIATVCEIRDAAATILRSQGYLAAVQVPPQRIEGGVVHFDVLMAKVVRVQVRGDAGKSEQLIASYLEGLKSDEVFNEKTAERYLLLARDLPGYDVRLTLRPAGGAPGEVLAEVSIDRTPAALEANIQNYGSHDVGRFGGLVRGEVYDLLGAGDRLSLGFFTTADFEEQQVVQAGYDVRVGREGLTLGGRFTYAWTHPDLGQQGEVRSKTLLASLEANYPFVRSQAANARGAFGFDLIDQKVRLIGLPTRDRLRVFYARLDFDAIDPKSIGQISGFSAGEPRWRVAGSVELRQGVSFLGGTDGCGPAPYNRCLLTGVVQPSRVDGRPDATIVRAVGQVEYRPMPNIAFSLSPRGQYSTKALFSFEEFSAGNYTVGRGYDPGSVIGDDGFGFQAEVRLGTLIPKDRDSFAVQPYAFVDQVWIWNKGAPSRTGLAQNGPDPQELTSVGGGVRVSFGDHARLDLSIAEPLDKVGTPARKPGTRLLVSLTTKLWPWR